MNINLNDCKIQKGCSALQFSPVDLYSLFFLQAHLQHIYSLGAASISLHWCPLTIQEEAPPP